MVYPSSVSFALPRKNIESKLRKRLHLRGRAKLTRLDFSDSESVLRVYTNLVIGNCGLVYKFTIRELLEMCHIDDSIIIRVNRACLSGAYIFFDLVDA